MDVFLHCFSYCAIVEVTAVPIKDQYLIVDRGGAVYIGKLGHGFYTSVSIHITIWWVMEYPVHWGL